MDERIPHGSVLRVLFFALAISDAVANIPAVMQCFLYFDDLAIYVSGAKLHCLERQLALPINEVTSWCDSKEFYFLPRKPKYIIPSEWYE